jgi:hypothetical protein
MSYSLKEQGQRKKIMDDRDRLYLQIEINKLLSNNSLFSTWL